MHPQPFGALATVNECTFGKGMFGNNSHVMVKQLIG